MTNFKRHLTAIRTAEKAGALVQYTVQTYGFYLLCNCNHNVFRSNLGFYLYIYIYIYIYTGSMVLSILTLTVQIYQ